MLACGNNLDGQCGVGSTVKKIATLTPVDLPDDVKGRVDRVMMIRHSSSQAAAALDVAMISGWGVRGG